MAELMGIQPPYPSFAALRMAKQAVLPSAAGCKLLFWPLDGLTLETSGLAVMVGPTNPDMRTPYRNPTTGVLHPISQLSICEPKVSSITVYVSELQDWESNWEDMHCEHIAGEEGDDDGDAGSDMCCGMARPAGKKDISVIVTGTGGITEGSYSSGGFVTVHDYVTVVHPWLMGLRNDILGALGTLNGDDVPLPAETELMVSYNMLDDLMIETRATWLRLTKKEPIAPSPGFSLRELMALNGQTHFGLRG